MESAFSFYASCLNMHLTSNSIQRTIERIGNYSNTKFYFEKTSWLSSTKRMYQSIALSYGQHGLEYVNRIANIMKPAQTQSFALFECCCYIFVGTEACNWSQLVYIFLSTCMCMNVCRCVYLCRIFPRDYCILNITDRRSARHIQYFPLHYDHDH